MKISTSAPTERVDELHATLANPYCRTILAHFADASENVTTVEALSTVVTDSDVRDVDGVMIELHHAALPKLDAAGVVDYDARSKTVRYRGHPALQDETSGSAEYESHAR